MILNPENILRDFNSYISSLPDFNQLDDNNSYMSITIELMNYVSYWQKIGLSTCPNLVVAEKGVTKRKAIILGHMIRQMKLYEGFLMHVAQRQFELSAIFVRLIYETDVRIDYLLKAKLKTFNSYILTSYKPDKKKLEDLNKKKQVRQLIPIEKRIREKIVNRLRRDGISQKKLMSNTNWKLNGKNFKDVLISLSREKEYSYLFGSGSDFIHGGWYELSNYHLEKKGRYYTPNLNYDDPDPRIACPISILCIVRLIQYLQWHKSDPEELIIAPSKELLSILKALDNAHEKFYQKRYTT